MTFELSPDRTGEKGAILGRCAERASRCKKQPIQRAQGRNSWRRGKEASVAGAEGPGGNRSRWEEGEGRFPSRQSLTVEEYNFFNCGKIRINTHKFKCTV